MSNTCTLDATRPGAPGQIPTTTATGGRLHRQGPFRVGDSFQTGTAVAPLPALGPLGSQLLRRRFPLTVRYPVRRVLPVLRVLPLGLVWSGGSLVRLGLRLRGRTVLA